MNKNTLLITTTTAQGASRTWAWDSRKPVGLGHPFRWVLERNPEGVRVREISMNLNRARAGGIHKIALGKPVELDELTVQVRHALTFDRFDGAVAMSSVTPFEFSGDLLENDTFKKALRATSAVLAAILLLTMVWPKSKTETEELIPPQFAKIVLSKPATHSKSPAASAAAPEMAAGAAKLPEKVRDAAVVQAFRAAALQNAVSGLLKGGMTKLLAQSDFAAGAASSSQARRIFDTQSKALQATAPVTGPSTDRNVKVAALGGEAGAAGVGYGTGKHAGVQGQGQAFVSMDVGGSSVEQGLTKDEVGEVIHRHLSEVRYCYESAMLRTPDIEGKLMVDFTIGGSGMVKSSEVKSSTLPDPRLDDCILRRLGTWKFPQPKGGVDVAVSYPFIFKTLGR